MRSADGERPALTKYTALGNTYLVYCETPGTPVLASLSETCRLLCDVHQGIGADGLLQLAERGDGSFDVTIWNPDGSVAEKSGNGIRIAAAHLWTEGMVQSRNFQLTTAGESVTCRVSQDGRHVSVDLGRARFDAEAIPVRCDADPVLDYPLRVGEAELRINAVSMGNPHCVLFCDEVTPALAVSFGPKIENHSIFPRRTNVQFAKVLDRGNIQIEIWERGAGYTLSSGTSSCAVAAVARRRGLVGETVAMHMPGGRLGVRIGENYSITLDGEVRKIADFQLDERFADLMSAT